MNLKQIRKEKIHQRIHILRTRYDRHVIGGLTMMSVGLAVCIGVILQEIHLSGTPVVADSYGSVLLRNGADSYVVIGITAFVAGVIFTILCIRIHIQQQQ